MEIPCHHMNSDSSHLTRSSRWHFAPIEADCLLTKQVVCVCVCVCEEECVHISISEEVQGCIARCNVVYSFAKLLRPTCQDQSSLWNIYTSVRLLVPKSRLHSSFDLCLLFSPAVRIFS